MASIIPGYENDIFISYRQKDNKHDGWVTEFVDNLKGELESTFKEGDLSRINAVLGNTEEAVTEFQKLIDSGWYDLNWMRNDPFWDYIRQDAEFKKIAQDMESRKNEMLMLIKENKSKIFSSGY